MNAPEAAHEALIRATFELAMQARQRGDHPFGALLANNGRILLTAANSVNTGRNVTHHAELNLVSHAWQQFEPDLIAQCTLYTSTEPCAMCAGAIYWAGIRAVVYGCPAEALGRLAGASFVVPCRHLFSQGKEPVAVVGPVLETEAVAVHEGFW